MDKAIVPHPKSTTSTGVQIADFIGAWVRRKSYNSSAADKNAPSRQCSIGVEAMIPGRLISTTLSVTCKPIGQIESITSCK